jgi:hypothetical protein
MAQAQQTYKPDATVIEANKQLDVNSFKGMVDSRMMK